MSVYMTEEEQIEAIKKWWQKYNNIIIIAVSLILLATAAYKYWHWHQEKINKLASNTYEHLLIAYSNQDNKSIQSYANQLIKEYNGTVYADVAHLTLAKLMVTRLKYEKAQEHLQFVAANSKMPALRQITKIRTARLLLAQKSYEKALNELDQTVDTTYLPLINEIKGDVYAASGQLPQAAASYQQALKAAETQDLGNIFLEMKTNEMAALTQSQKRDDKTLSVG